jgi:hypothetical protein
MVSDLHHFSADPDPDPAFHFLRIRLQLFISMLIWIRIQILLLIKVMPVCHHWPGDPPGLQYEHPRLHFECSWPSMALLPRMLLHFTLMETRIRIQLSKNNADPDSKPCFKDTYISDHFWQCCGSGSEIRCLFDPWSGIRDRLIPDFKPIFFRALWQFFLIKSSIILWKLAQIWFFNSSKIK